jgi:hypothetical protein
VSIPAALRNRARAAYRATSYAEGDNSWSHFVAKAIEAETARREAEHNDGEMYPSWGENLAKLDRDISAGSCSIVRDGPCPAGNA